MSQRTHEFLLSGDAQSYDRLGFRYTEGDRHIELIHPDSQHSEQKTNLVFDEFQSLLSFLQEIEPVFEGTQEDPT